MHLLQGFLLIISLVVRVTALIACNGTSVKPDQTVTTTTTVTPIVTMLEPNPNYTEVMSAYPNTTITVTVTISCPEPEDSVEIDTTFSTKAQYPPALINGSALATNTGRPLMALRTPPTSPTSIAMCNLAVGNTGFNPTNNCSLSGPTSFVLSATSTLASTSTVMSTTNLPTPSLSSDTIESTSTTVVVVSLAASTPIASATFVQGTSTTTSTSAARPRPQPLSAFFWSNLVATRARDQISNAFEGWAKAEKAKSFFDTKGAALDATTTTNQYPAAVASSTGNNLWWWWWWW